MNGDAMALQQYQRWQESTVLLDIWWQKRVDAACFMVEMSARASEGTRAGARAALLVCQHGQVRNTQFLLLMLLRTRARGGC